MVLLFHNPGMAVSQFFIRRMSDDNNNKLALSSVSENGILFKAVENKNVSEVEEILKQCTQEILEFRGGKVSICSTICSFFLL